MNILVINGSPRGERSNSLRLTNAFVQGMREACGDASVETLAVSRLNIQPCKGCFACWKHTPGACCLSDDMQNVLQKMLWADVTIWSFPLYYYGLPGPLKTLMDRQLPVLLPFMTSDAEGGGHPTRHDISGKKTMLISTCGFYTAQANYAAVTAQFDRLCGEGQYTTLFCGQGELFSVPELSSRTDAYLACVRQAGREYGQGGIAPDTQAKLRELLYPRDVFERMADASWGVNRDGEKEDDSLVFTRQMAALYNPASYAGRDIILDMDYTDVGKRYRIVLGRSESRVTEVTAEPATTVIHTPIRVWRAIAAGEIEGSAALMQHQYTVEGDFALLMHWDDYFGSPQSEPQPQPDASAAAPAKDKTDMSCLLLPWIAFWIGPAIDAFWGSLASIAACAAVYALFYRQKKTVYDALSGLMVPLFAVALLVGCPALYVVPLSYLAFGVMWSASACLKIPLTAHYSMYGYGGESALRNPIFVRTNRILTAMWGVLYLVTPIWTYFLMQTDVGSYVGLINSLLPAAMGAFTAWFQKWYPQKVARGGA